MITVSRLASHNDEMFRLCQEADHGISEGLRLLDIRNMCLGLFILAPWMRLRIKSTADTGVASAAL